jgi:hypothetical protein
MADYRLTADDYGVIRTADQAYIPNSTSNYDWLEYQAWLDAGGVPDPYVPPEIPPPPPDPNARLDTGVQAAVDSYNQHSTVPQQLPGGSGGLSTEERLIRLEETLKAMCDGQMNPAPPPEFSKVR